MPKRLKFQMQEQVAAMPVFSDYAFFKAAMERTGQHSVHPSIGSRPRPLRRYFWRSPPEAPCLRFPLAAPAFL